MLVLQSPRLTSPARSAMFFKFWIRRSPPQKTKTNTQTKKRARVIMQSTCSCVVCDYVYLYTYIYTFKLYLYKSTYMCIYIYREIKNFVYKRCAICMCIEINIQPYIYIYKKCTYLYMYIIYSLSLYIYIHICHWMSIDDLFALLIPPFSRSLALSSVVLSISYSFISHMRMRYIFDAHTCLYTYIGALHIH